jgi:hypothetical protein
MKDNVCFVKSPADRYAYKIQDKRFTVGRDFPVRNMSESMKKKNRNDAPASMQFFLKPISVPPGNIVGLLYGQYKSMPFFIPLVIINY